MRLSAAMIVRDEEKFLDGCLQSIAPHVDEIVVVDTGSKDRTVDIATSHGVRLFERAWPGDFATARNWALDEARGDWILYIDADERLSVPPGEAVRSTVASAAEFVALSVHFHPRVGYTPYREIRLFRNDPAVRFTGVIHESVMQGLVAKAKREGRIFGDSPFSIMHLGYEGDLSHKHRRNLPLLVEAARNQPNRVYHRQQLTEIYGALGEMEKAFAAFREAIDIVKSRENDKQRADASLCAHSLALVLIARGEDALPVIEEGLAVYPGHKALSFLRAKEFVRLGRHAEALPILDALVAEGAGGFRDPLVAYDRRIFGELAEQLRGVALLRLGRSEEAADAFERAAAAAPEDLGQRARAIATRAMVNRRRAC
jgi:Flp pilus assembly protein TadD